MAKRYTRNKRRRKTRKMRGGFDLNETIPENESHNLDIGELNLDDDSFESQGSLHLSDLDSQLGMNDSGNTTEQDISQIEGIPHFDVDAHDLNMDDDSLHLSDLDVTNDSVNTTTEDASFGGRKRKRRMTKKRKGKKGRKTRKNRRKQKGGTCYGRGVGSNSYDPNYSVYNTNMLKLFPYRPTK